MTYESFTRSNAHHVADIRRIARSRFGTEYWAAIDAALETALESHSMVQYTPNKDKRIAAFVLVCPPLFANRTAYGVDSKVPADSLEIAFVATDAAWEGHGFARSLLEAVLFRCKTAQQSAWLHVDTINAKAHAFYERLGFRDLLRATDPFGSAGVVMLFSEGSACSSPHSRPWGNYETLERLALFNAGPCEPEQTLRRGVFPPPRLACC